MTEIAQTLSLLTTIILMVVSSDVVNGACQPALREYQMHQGNKLAFYPSPIKDNVFKDTIYEMRKARSDVVCAVHCLQDDSCKSFNYCSDTLCQLKTTNYSVKGYEAVTSAGCRHYGDEELQTEESAPTTIKASCYRNYTAEPLYTQVDEPLNLPMRLEFSVRGPEQANVYLSPNSRDLSRATVRIILMLSGFAIYRKQSDSNSWAAVNPYPIPDIFGKQLYVAYDNSHIEAQFKGLEDTYVSYDMPSPLNVDRMFVILLNSEQAEWTFFDPCTPFTLTWRG